MLFISSQNKKKNEKEKKQNATHKLRLFGGKNEADLTFSSVAESRSAENTDEHIERSKERKRRR